MYRIEIMQHSKVIECEPIETKRNWVDKAQIIADESYQNGRMEVGYFDAYLTSNNRVIDEITLIV